ncbi:MAG: tetratricopeptide repeat protein, partial [Melioribacteraceae bacterium]
NKSSSVIQGICQSRSPIFTEENLKLKFKIICAVLLFLNLSVSAQSQIQSLIQQGMNQAYNMEFKSAEKTFNRVLELRPNSPLGYYYISKIHFWTYLGSRDQGEYTVFMKFAELAQQKVDKALEADPKDFQMTYIAGNLASYKAMAQATFNSTVDAFWASKKAVGFFEETLELNPKFYDAYLGLGLFDYAMSFVPDFLKWAVNLTGLTSDKERGFRYIKTAFRKGTYDKTEAAFHLSKIYTDYLAEYDSAYTLLQNLSSRYPDNVLFGYQSSIALIKDRQLDRAVQVLNRVIALENKKMPQVTALAYFRKAEILFKKNQFRAAIKQYDKFLDSSKELDLTGLAAYNRALCYKFLGNNLQFRQNLLLARGGNLDVFEDSYAKHKSEKFLANEITPADLKLIRMRNYLDSGKDNIVLDSLKAEISNSENSESRAVSLIYYSEAAMNLKRYSEASHNADLALAVEQSTEKWVEPMAKLLKAKARYFSGALNEAKSLLQDAQNSNEYEFADSIQSQIEWLKRKLNRQ